MLEKLFGPEGYFAKNNGHIVDDVKNYVTQAVNYAKNRGLNNIQARSLPNEVRHINYICHTYIFELLQHCSLYVLGFQVLFLHSLNYFIILNIISFQIE